MLAAVFPDVSASDVRAGVVWDLRARVELDTIEPPTDDEIRTLQGLDTPVNENDRVSIVPAMAGGRE